MTRRSILVPIVAGFSITLLILLAVIAASVSHIDRVGSQMTTIILERSRKADMASRMQDLHRQRYQSLVTASQLQEPFDRDEELQAFARLAGEYIQLRDQFLALPLDAQEQGLWEAIRTSLRRAETETAAIEDLLAGEQLTVARQRLQQRLAPLQKRMMADWQALASLQRDKNAAALSEAVRAEQRIRRLAVLLGGAALLMGVAIAAFAIRASRRLEQGQRGATEQLQGVLNALPDAVLQCDAEGRLQYMNRMAKRLLGRQDARQSPITQALNLIDRSSRDSLTAKLIAELQHGHPVALPQDTCLVSGDGMEYEVTGTGIPLTDADGRSQGAVLSLRDVTESHALQRQQTDRVELDPITWLPTERLLVERLERNLLSKRAVDRELAYLHIELDGIDPLAREAGQAVADQFLREVAQVLLSRIRDSDTLSRVGERAFGLLLPACPREVSERLLQTLEASVAAIGYDWHDKRYAASARIGIVHTPPFAGAYDECQAEAKEAARRLKPTPAA